MAAAGAMQATSPFFQQCCSHPSSSSSTSSTGASSKERRIVSAYNHGCQRQHCETKALFPAGLSSTKNRRDGSSSSSSFRVSSSPSSSPSPSPARLHCPRMQCRQQHAGKARRRSGVTRAVATGAEAEAAVDGRSKDRGDEDTVVGPQEWNAGKVISVENIAPGVRNIVLELEVSREYVELANAYTLPGELATIKVPTTTTINGDRQVEGGDDDGMTKVTVPCSSGPFSMKTNHAVLLKLRGDISAGDTKVSQYMLSVKAPLHVYVEQSKAGALYDVAEGSEVMVGPFQKTGLDFLPIMFLTRFPTILIFSDDGPGIAVARAVIEARDVGSLLLHMREEVRLFYSAATPATMAYRDLFQEWENKNIKVRPTVRNTDGDGSWNGFVGSFSQLFDEDDLEYDPEATAAVVCGSRQTIDEVMALLEEAGIPESQVVQWESR